MVKKETDANLRCVWSGGGLGGGAGGGGGIASGVLRTCCQPAQNGVFSRRTC